MGYEFKKTKSQNFLFICIDSSTEFVEKLCYIDFRYKKIILCNENRELHFNEIRLVVEFINKNIDLHKIDNPYSK